MACRRSPVQLRYPPHWGVDGPHRVETVANGLPLKDFAGKPERKKVIHHSWGCSSVRPEHFFCKEDVTGSNPVSSTHDQTLSALLQNRRRPRSTHIPLVAFQDGLLLQRLGPQPGERGEGSLVLGVGVTTMRVWRNQADAPDSKSGARKGVRVRFPLLAP